MGHSRISVNTPEGTNVLEGALRNALDSGRRIGDTDLPREGTVLPGGSGGTPGSINLVGLDWKKLCDDPLLGMVVVVLSEEIRRCLRGGCSISHTLWSIV